MSANDAENRPPIGDSSAEKLKAELAKRKLDAQCRLIDRAERFRKSIAPYLDRTPPVSDGGECVTVEYAPRIIIGSETSAAAKESIKSRRSDPPPLPRGERREEKLELIRRLSDEVAEELPERFYEKLNGGISLTERVKYHAESRPERPLLVLGEYRFDPRTGSRSIMLYGGSIIKKIRALSAEELKRELRGIIRHEFTHHLESLGGERGLEIEDEIMLKRYKEAIKTLNYEKKTK